MSALLQPIKIRNKTVRNRLAKSASGETRSSVDGFVTEDYVSWYRDFAKGGLGLIHSGAVYVMEEGKVVPFQPGLDHDDKIPGFRRVAEEVHRFGCLFLAQLNHPGRQLFPVPGLVLGKDHLNDIDVVAPSPVRNQSSLIKPRELSEKEIEEIIENFIAAAIRAEKAGLDGVQVHAAHGFLISSFISRRTNKRKDQYGGSLENRLRVLTEIVKGIRKHTGEDFLVTIKLNWFDGPFPKGITRKQLAEMMGPVNQLDIDAIEISSGSNEWLSFSRGKFPAKYFLKYGSLRYMPAIQRISFALGERFLEMIWRHFEGFNMKGVNAIRELTDKPIICTGGFTSVEAMSGIIERGEGDIIASARQFICDQEYANKLTEHRESEIHWCTFCNKCVARCGIKPTECYERKDPDLYFPPTDWGIRDVDPDLSSKPGLY